MPKNRKKERLLILERQIISLTSQFYKFFKANVGDVDAQQEEIKRLNAQYLKYLRSNRHIYDFRDCRGNFTIAIDSMLTKSLVNGEKHLVKKP